VDPGALCNEPGAGRCEGFDYEVCIEGRWFRQETCAAPTPLCDPTFRCTTCQADFPFCVDRNIYQCNGDGTAAELIDSCDVGEKCLQGTCYNACTIAEQTNSYLGCRFLAVRTANQLGPAFDDDFAVVLANASNTDPAEVTIRQGGVIVQGATVLPRETTSIQLPVVTELQDTTQSRRVTDGAFEVTSSVPIAAHQYNPLHFQLDLPSGEVEHSYTNDASLLLPEHVLTGSYLLSTWPTWGYGDFPGISVQMALR
jgi:hypothetical protein